MRAEAAVRFANETFYEAFRKFDLKTMDLLWAQRHPVACIHPGWPALLTRESIMESWAGIFESPVAPCIQCHHVEVFLNETNAFVVCYESVEGSGTLVATNVFAWEDEQWRMVHHHAGPCHEAPKPPPAGEAGPSGLQ